MQSSEKEMRLYAWLMLLASVQCVRSAVRYRSTTRRGGYCTVYCATVDTQQQRQKAGQIIAGRAERGHEGVSAVVSVSGCQLSCRCAASGPTCVPVLSADSAAVSTVVPPYPHRAFVSCGCSRQ